MPNDGSWLALALWALGIGAVAWFWDILEQKWLEWQWRRRQRRTARAWARWYSSHPCKRADLEPRTKAGRL